MLDADRADRLVHVERVDPQERRDFIVGKIEIDARPTQLRHLSNAQIHEWAERMIDDGACMADSLTFFGERVDLGVGCVAEEQRHVAVFKSAMMSLYSDLSLPCLSSA